MSMSNQSCFDKAKEYWILKLALQAELLMTVIYISLECIQWECMKGAACAGKFYNNYGLRMSMISQRSFLMICVLRIRRWQCHFNVLNVATYVQTYS